MKFEEIFKEVGLYKSDSFAKGTCFEIKKNLVTDELELYLTVYKDKDDILPNSKVI